MKKKFNIRKSIAVLALVAGLAGLFSAAPAEAGSWRHQNNYSYNHHDNRNHWRSAHAYHHRHAVPRVVYYAPAPRPVKVVRYYEPVYYAPQLFSYHFVIR